MTKVRCSRWTDLGLLGRPGTLEENHQLLEMTIGYPAEFLHYHVGWFQETLPADHEAIGPIAIFRSGW